ncbi:MAG TPA: N-acetylneuraminate synthase family protein, partial [Candidatus Babeliales bacterium]|nr:N-acetylneuraminate synthase family protein [Candidatus Babeliales bacterium]
MKKYGFSTDNKVYVIAEIGLNHGGDINTAKRLIDSASRTGVDAVKFQTYLTEKRVPKNSPIFDILKKCELPFEAFKEIKDYTETYNIEFFSTPFDEESVDFLESINCALYKVASFDVVNYKLLSKIADTKKTIIMSVGMANLSEIEEAFKILNNKTKKLAILHCISAYPTKEEDANLSAVYTLKEKFDCVIGQSDHTNGIIVPVYAVAAGAQVIEKHYKIDENMNCVDAPVSISEG